MGFFKGPLNPKETRQVLVLVGGAVMFIGSVALIGLGWAVARAGLSMLAVSLLESSRQAALSQVFKGSMLILVPVLGWALAGWWLLTHRYPPDGPEG